MAVRIGRKRRREEVFRVHSLQFSPGWLLKYVGSQGQGNRNYNDNFKKQAASNVI